MNKNNKKGGSLLPNTSGKVERTIVLIKPEFTKLNLIEAKVIEKILLNEDITLILQKKGKMSKKQARSFYIDKIEKSFYDELTEYMSSGEIIAFVFEGIDAIKTVRKIVEDLRTELKSFYNIKDDVMKNVLHATNKKIKNGIETDEDFMREFKIIKQL